LTDRHVTVLVTGISAAGKTTVADLLARCFERAAHVKGDVFRRMVVAGRAEMTSEPSAEAWRQLRLRYSLAASTADAYFAAGFSVVVQDIAVGPVLQEYVDMLRSRPLCVVVLAPAAAAVAQREGARAKTAYRPGFDDIDPLDEGLRRDTPRLGLWLDTSDQTPDETVDEIVRRAWDEAQVN
jgi:hypothetical protein